jgi:hypothetical protein
MNFNAFLLLSTLVDAIIQITHLIGLACARCPRAIEYVNG